MRPEGLAAAQRELKRALRAQKRFVAGQDFEDAEDAWADFLTHANRLYVKLRAACHGQPLDWTWWKKKLDERRDDPLLAYIHHARNCDTHRLEDTTQRMPAGEYVAEIPGGRFHYSIEQHLRPLPVTDKGILYPNPQWHMGRPHGFADVAFMALVAGRYLQDLVAEANSRLR